ncbi:MAG: WbqC family protein [Proteobacteria bacterium]|nr:WbqC family protein [Pseudomonadota bacterium]
MIVSINQPAYMPWLGYFDRIDASDLYVVLDHVQFEKNSFVNRNRIRTPNGTAWLTIPISTSGRFGDLPINALQTADGGRWRKKHLAALRANYAGTEYFKEIEPDLKRLYSDDDGNGSFIAPVMKLTELICSLLNVTTPMVLSSSLNADQTKSDLVLQICEKIGADGYISGPFGRDYLDLDKFAKRGIKVWMHDYESVDYRQAWPGFESHLAAIDAVSTLGPQGARQVMLAGRRLT